MEKALEKTVWIDDVKLIATLAVIVLHVASPAVSLYSFLSDINSNWWISNFYNSFCRFCVPLFIMVTGALLLPQEIGLKLFLHKRLKRILLPLIFWTAVYIIFNLGLKFRDFGYGAMDDFWPWFYLQLIQGPSIHLWYVYMIIGLYLFIPIIQPWIQQATDGGILYFLGIWLLIVVVNQLHIVTVSSPFDIRYFSSYLGYLVLGYYLAERLIPTDMHKRLSVVVFAFGFLVTLIGTFIVSKQKKIFSEDFYHFLTINVVFASIGMFVFVKNRKSTQPSLKYVIFRNFINKYGYGIYLGHVLVLNILSHFGIDYGITTPLLSIPFVAMICLILTCSMIYTLDRLPYGKYIAR